MYSNSQAQAEDLLRRFDIVPTPQRVEITRLLMGQREHMSAEDVYRLVNSGGRRVSKATVYNTLGLMSDKGIIREVIADPARVFYDPNTQPHHHFFDVTTGRLQDIDADMVQVSGLPPLPEGATLDGVEVIVRYRSAKSE
jgi:Fur family iron response transcriptional regulator